jgi:hypothetical protein
MALRLQKFKIIKFPISLSNQYFNCFYLDENKLLPIVVLIQQLYLHLLMPKVFEKNF